MPQEGVRCWEGTGWRLRQFRGVAIIRTYRSADLAALVGLLQATLTAEKIDEARFTRQVLLDPNFKPEGALIAEEAGKIAGFALAIARQVPIEGAMPDRERGYVTLFAVDPGHQRKGIGAVLLDQAEIFLITERRKEVWISTYSPAYFTPGVDVETYSSGVEFFKKFGYEEVYRPLSMETSTAVEPPAWVVEKEAQALRDGVIFAEWKPELTLHLLRFAKEEFGPDWARYVREAAGAILGGAPNERLWIAYQADAKSQVEEDDWFGSKPAKPVATGPKILGLSHFEGERFGPIGVAASERGRGIGQVLMFKTLASQRKAGHERSYFMWSDDKTARRLYDSAGFKEVRRFAVLKKEI
jgi:mycothiol synthase